LWVIGQNHVNASNPNGGVIQATNGSFYGTTELGGTDNQGTIFEFSTGLGPFVETVPTGGKVGAKVLILGNNLSGTTSVSFNGTAAAFEVVSETEITATVPVGAATGEVEVTTPKRTLKSNVKFMVTP
jgi:large repetitive protein